MSTAIDVQNLTVKLGSITALQHVNLTLAQGQIIGFIGPSGAGKTTLIRSIVGRQKLTTGSIEVLGQPAGSAHLRPQVSYMTQERSVYPDLSVSENLSYFATMFGLPRPEIKTNIRRILKELDLTAQANQLYAHLSGGQKQRASLAVSLIGQPKLLLLDEPTVGLDPVLREQLWRLFHQLKDQGATLIISSHVMEEAERCDDLVLIREGHLLFHSPPDQLKTETHKNSVEQAFLSLVEDKK